MNAKFDKPGRISLCSSLPAVLVSILILIHHVQAECMSRPLGLLSGIIYFLPSFTIFTLYFILLRNIKRGILFNNLWKLKAKL